MAVMLHPTKSSCVSSHTGVVQPSLSGKSKVFVGLKLQYASVFIPDSTYEKIKKDLSQMKRFNAQEALDYGLIDRIIRPPRIKPDAPRKD